MSSVHIKSDETGRVTACWDSFKGDVHIETFGSSSAAALAKLARELGERLEVATDAMAKAADDLERLAPQ